MQKRILKKIAAEWAAGILLHGTGMDSFEPELGLTYEEEGYIVEEVHRLGKSLMKTLEQDIPAANLEEIVQKYYDFE